jgi:hypothetical protein
MGHNSGLTAKQREAITGRYDEKHGRWIIIGVLSPRGRKPSLMDALANKVAGRENLEKIAAVLAVGQQALEQCALKWDSSRAKLWTFAKPRVEGAMKNYLNSTKPGRFYSYDETNHHNDQRAGNDWNGTEARVREDWRAEGDLESPRDKARTQKKLKPVAPSPIDTATVNESRLIQTRQNADGIETLMTRAGLDPVERAAFKNQYANPGKPISWRSLAAQLSTETKKVSHTWIGHCLKAATKKMRAIGTPV